jgi:hypothetical protein
MGQSHRFSRIHENLSFKATTTAIPLDSGPGYSEPITAHHIADKLSRLKKGKAPGASGLTIDILSHSTYEVHNAVATLLNTCIREGKVPSQWHTAHILTVPKTEHPTGLNQVRPIALLEVLLKLLTSFQADGLSKVWYESNIFEGTQHSSLPGHSVAAPLHIVRCIYEAAAQQRLSNQPNKRHMHVLYCDYAKAFDSIPGFIVEAAMRTLGVPEQHLALFAELDKKAWTKILTSHGLTNGFHPEKGIRQGDSASPLRFIAILNILMETLKEKKIGWRTETGEIVFGHAYADDCWLITESQEDLQTLTDIVSQFCNAIHLGINSSKSYYTTTDDTAADIMITLPDGSQSPAAKRKYTDSIRYLGINISLDLNWKNHIAIMDEHIRAVCNKINSAPISYVQSQFACNLILGGFANFHFQFVDIPRTDIKAWDNRILNCLNRKLGLPQGTSHLQHTLPCLAGKHYYRTLESMWDAIQIGETFIRLNDTKTLMARLTKQRLLALCEDRGTTTCCLKTPSPSKRHRRYNHMVAVENSLAHLGMNLDTDTLITSHTSTRTWDIPLSEAIPPPHFFTY